MICLTKKYVFILTDAELNLEIPSSAHPVTPSITAELIFVDSAGDINTHTHVPILRLSANSDVDLIIFVINSQQ